MLNSSSNLYSREWLAVIFNNRNQNYGAYVLRLQSSSILLRSFLIVSGFFILFFIIPLVYSKTEKPQIAIIEREVPITLISPAQPLVKKEPEKALAQPVSKIKSVKFSAPKVVHDDVTVAAPPTTQELSQSTIGPITQLGEENSGNVQISQNPGNGESTGTATGNGDTEIYNVAGLEAYPEFPGGMAAWAKFIQKNLKYPGAALDNGTQGKVYLSFVIEKDGSITDVNVLRGIGFGCDEEAVRVIKKSPRWKAGFQNNRMVRVRYTMPIQYTLN